MVFGAVPIGLGATVWLKLRGVKHVAVADVIPERLERATTVGADAVLDSSREDVTARLTELHGEGANALGAPRPDTDIYIDAAGAAAVLNTALAAAKRELAQLDSSDLEMAAWASEISRASAKCGLVSLVMVG